MINRPTDCKYTIGASQKGALTIGVILYTLVSGFAQPAPVITFNAPGAGTGAGQGTVAVNINDFGQAIGYFVDTNNVYHGFVRAVSGAVVNIDAPGAGALAGSGQGTFAYSINIEGMIAGEYQDTNYVYHSFLREPGGHFITFDAPRAGTGPNQGTFAVDVNLAGEIAGYTQDNSNVFHGFLRSPSGAFTSFDAPNAGTGPYQGTMATLESGLNPLGALIGWYYDSSNVGHGYVRQPGGVIISFDPPGSVATYPGSINPQGLIVGGFADANSVLHGFVRRASGAIVIFDVPGAGSTPGLFEGTLALGVTPLSLITGYWADSNTIYHGFVRYPNGTISKFDAPGAGTIPGSLQGTVPQGMNDWGEIVGYLQDSNYVNHGFVGIP
jgi:hypothetical protein